MERYSSLSARSHIYGVYLHPIDQVSSVLKGSLDCTNSPLVDSQECAPSRVSLVTVSVLMMDADFPRDDR